MREKILNIIAETIAVEATQLNDETAIGDFPKWDSLGHLSIIAKLEAAFNFKFDPETLMDLEDIGDIVEAIEERI